MEISRYASRLAPDSRVLPSGRPPTKTGTEKAVNLPQVPFETNVLNMFPVESAPCLPEEPDDAKLTGGTRSLSRRLLALNFPGITRSSDAAAPSEAHGAGKTVTTKLKAHKVALAKTELIKQHA